VDYEKMINAAVNIARKGETEHAKIMLLGIMALSLNEVNKSLNHLETRVDKQEAMLAHLVRSVAKLAPDDPAVTGDSSSQ
jgi:hypothetical protein